MILKRSVKPDSIGRALSRILDDAMNHDRLPIIFLAIVVFAFFLPSLVTPGALIWPHSGLGSDISYRHWPDLIGYAQSWRAGRVPVWDSLVALGRPLAGDPTVLFLYPFDIMFAWIPPALAFNSLNALHVFLAGLFTYLFLRVGYETSRPAALVSAFAFAFAPKFISHLAGGHVGLVWGAAWVPAALLGLKLAFDGWLLGAALGGLALAVQMPTHLQMPYYTAGLASAYWAWHIAPPLWRALRGCRDDWRSVRWLAVTYAVWLGAFALLAAAVLLPLLELLPYNGRSNFTLAEANLFALPLLMLITMFVPSNFQFPEWTMFLGLIPLALAALAWQGYRQRPWSFFALLAFCALIFSLGTSTPFFALANALIPGLRMLRVPTRVWFFGGLAVAVLAGFGADLLGQDGAHEWLRRRSKRLVIMTATYMTGGLLAWLGYWVMFRRWHQPMSLRLVTAAAVILVGGLWLGGRLSGRAMQWALVPLLLFDLLPLNSAYIDLVDPHATFLHSTPALDYVSAQTGIFRIFSVAGDLPYAVAAARGVETLEGLLAFQAGYAGNAIRKATGCKTTSYATAVPPCLTDRVRTAVPDAEKLGRLNVRYVLTHEPVTDPNFMSVMAGAPAVYENLVWQPRARLTSDGAVEIIGRSAGEFEIRVDVAAPGQLIVAETWLPGWQAVVDGQPRRAERVEDALIGVMVGPGDHRVHLSYQPLGWRIGWPISVAAFATLLLWCTLAWRRMAA